MERNRFTISKRLIPSGSSLSSRILFPWSDRVCWSPSSRYLRNIDESAGFRVSPRLLIRWFPPRNSTMNNIANGGFIFAIYSVNKTSTPPLLIILLSKLSYKRGKWRMKLRSHKASPAPINEWKGGGERKKFISESLANKYPLCVLLSR